MTEMMFKALSDSKMFQIKEYFDLKWGNMILETPEA